MVLFCAIPFCSFCQNVSSPSSDTGVLNNAALSMRYYNKFYSVPPNEPTTDSAYWEKTLVVLNDEKILTKAEFLHLDKRKIISAKEILNPDDKHIVKRVLLLKTK